MSIDWKIRMAHEKAWRDSGVELGYRSAPTVPDTDGSLGIAGPLRRMGPALTQRFLDKGHNHPDCELCKCARAPSAFH